MIVKVKKEAAPKAEKKAPAKKEAAPKKAKAAGGAIDYKLYDVLLKPVITEKSTRQIEQNKVTFKIAQGATKRDVKKAVEQLFNVTVTKVNTINVEGKEKRFKNTLGQRKDYRKAIVTLKAGDSIDIAAGLR